jgi:hypothetical protein
LVAGGTRMRGLTRAVAALYPGGTVRPAYLVAPRWVVAALAPLLGVGRDFIEASWGAPPRISAARAEQQLGLRGWVPLETSLLDMVEDLAAKGLVRHPLAGTGAGTAAATGKGARRRGLALAAAVAVAREAARLALPWVAALVAMLVGLMLLSNFMGMAVP